MDILHKKPYNGNGMKKDDYGSDVFRSLAMISQFGINMIVPILLCAGLGLFIDRKLGTQWVCIAGFFLGALAGFRNIYIFAKKIYSNPGMTKRQRKPQRPERAFSLMMRTANPPSHMNS